MKNKSLILISAILCGFVVVACQPKYPAMTDSLATEILNDYNGAEVEYSFKVWSCELSDYQQEEGFREMWLVDYFTLMEYSEDSQPAGQMYFYIGDADEWGFTENANDTYGGCQGEGYASHRPSFASFQE